MTASGTDKGRALIARGEWVSYRDGHSRMVTSASIEARRARLLAGANSAFKEPAELRRTRKNRGATEVEARPEKTQPRLPGELGLVGQQSPDP